MKKKLKCQMIQNAYFKNSKKQKSLEMRDVKQQGKNLKIVVVPYNTKNRENISNNIPIEI